MRDLINIINESQNNPLTNKKSMTLSEYIQQQDIPEERKMKLQSLAETKTPTINIPRVFDLNKKVKADSNEYNVFVKLIHGFMGVDDDTYKRKNFDYLTEFLDDKYTDYMLKSDNLIELYHNQPKIQEYIKNTWNIDDNTSMKSIQQTLETSITLGQKKRGLRSANPIFTKPVSKYLKLHDLILNLSFEDIIEKLFPTYKDIITSFMNWGVANHYFYKLKKAGGEAWSEYVIEFGNKKYSVYININKNVIETKSKSRFGEWDEDE